MEKIKRFFKEEEGVTAIEYGLIAAIIAVGIIAALGGVRAALVNIFGDVSAELNK
jgi:pilus assembly protein Flp/PilA